MTVPIMDKSVTSVSEPVVHVSGDVVVIDLGLHCNHAQAAVIRSDEPFTTYRVVCLGCRGEEMSESDRDNIILDSIK